MKLFSNDLECKPGLDSGNFNYKCIALKDYYCRRTCTYIIQLLFCPVTSMADYAALIPSNVG
jgi:hypothetical protein